MRWAVRAFGCLTAPAAGRFERALAQPGAAQEALQRSIATRMARTAWGRHHGLRGPDDFGRLPVQTWEDLAPWIDRQRAEEGPILVPERVIFYEKTSGSSGSAKHIPYTARLRSAFSRMFSVWAHDLIVRGPPLSTGRVFFSISPSFDTERETDRGVPVGLEDDSEYLDGWLRPLLRPFFVAPPGLGRIRDPEAFRRALCTALVADARLEVISIWNPSFLKVHLDWIAAHREELAAGLTAPRRAALLADPIRWTDLWPHLALISCWTGANAALQARWIAAAFPGVLVQGKGLLATEAPMTLPLVGAPAPVPVVDGVLLELLDEDGTLHPLADAEQGRTYEVVLSQEAGLVRYRIGDRVTVSGTHGGSPCLVFEGRAGSTCDLVGEKLNEAFVQRALGGLLDQATFACLVPRLQPRPGYVLLLDRIESAPEALAASVEEALCAAYHYRHARLLGQLTPVSVSVSPSWEARLLAAAERAGRKQGDEKPRLLLTRPVDGLELP